MLLKAYAEAAACNGSDAQRFDEAVAAKDVAQAHAAIQVLRVEAEERFTAAGGRDFQATADGLVKFMKKRKKTAFGKQLCGRIAASDGSTSFLFLKTLQLRPQLQKLPRKKLRRWPKLSYYQEDG